METPNPNLIPSRFAKRAYYDEAVICAILDEALFCTISYCVEGMPASIPTSFVRYENKVYVHGSIASHFIIALEKSIPVCLTFMVVDALVVAKSGFNHSVNYRSVVLFGNAEKIENFQIKVNSFEWLINKMVPGSWNYLRPIKDSEVNRTTVLAFDIRDASAKLRQGMPGDEKEDKLLKIWSGIIPLKTERLKPIPDESSIEIAIPRHLIATED